jgi:hypothetical protein
VFVFFVNLIGKPAFSKCEHIRPGIHIEEIIDEIHIVDMNHILVIIVEKNIRIKITDGMIIRIEIMKIMGVEETAKNIDETGLIEGVDMTIKTLQVVSPNYYSFNQLSVGPHLV